MSIVEGCEEKAEDELRVQSSENARMRAEGESRRPYMKSRKNRLLWTIQK